MFAVLVFAISADTRYDAATANKIKQEAKAAILAEFESRMQSKPGEDTNDLFSSKMLFRLINNIEVSVRRIHIRFEDDGTASKTPAFAAGIELHSLEARSTDADWRPTGAPPADITARKV